MKEESLLQQVTSSVQIFHTGLPVGIFIFELALYKISLALSAEGNFA